MSEQHEPKNHIVRSRPPWTTLPPITECGRPVNDVGQTITPEQFLAAVKKNGKQRTAMSTCMTCWNAGGRVYAAWDSNPAECVTRHLSRRYQDPAILNELHALALLIETHRVEWESLLVGLDETSDLAAKRVAKRYQQQWYAGQ